MFLSRHSSRSLQHEPALSTCPYQATSCLPCSCSGPCHPFTPLITPAWLKYLLSDEAMRHSSAPVFSHTFLTASNSFRPTWGEGGCAVFLLVVSAPITHTVVPVTHSRPQQRGYCICTAGFLANAIHYHSAINTLV